MNVQSNLHVQTCTFKPGGAISGFGRKANIRRNGEVGELAPHSTTSSARPSIDGGTMSPSTFAVLRLIFRSNRVGS